MSDGERKCVSNFQNRARVKGFFTLKYAKRWQKPTNNLLASFTPR